MSHMVIFQTPDGNPGYNQFESLDEAVRFVEKLRNEQSVETARMFALEEVKFDFKPYFRVELEPAMVGPGPSSASSNDIGRPSPQASTPLPPPPSMPSAFTPAPAPPVTFGDPPGGSGVSDPQSPVGAEPASVGAAPPPPTFMAPPNSASGEENQTTRRGLFGR